MAKILEINASTILIGLDNGTIKEVPSDSVNFVPHVGDQVEIFETANRVIVSKLEPTRSTQYQPTYQQIVQPPPNIIINNANNNVNNNINGGYRGGNPKSKWVALLLCFFLGVLGAHKFYEGRVGMGILYILTVGLFGIGVLIDFIALLFKPNPYYV